ncbi:family 16 glycosylhydrolase [Microvirga brassicacearum]|uniref:Glycosyl hydrolase family protein n=1 Tax=Microvirga brassicacearum TaxID=2580413 RepID=A0A5N3PDC1_9HYPH|nr:family 16 glycosylhydrolase [Microvirga brassicacearum]KAB0267732.1 glycosyl hydrolase family protein [Microvirga brassicacearum]
MHDHYAEKPGFRVTPPSVFSIQLDDSICLPRRMQALRKSRRVRWMGHPLTYTVGTAIASVLSIGTTLLAPSLLGPAAFGSFALLTSLFQYASRFDLGLSQLADRDLAAGAVSAPGRDAEILYANWAAGALILVLIVPFAAIVASYTSTMTPLDTILAVGGGALAMVANAPVTIFRASAKVWEFTAVALTLQAGMTLPRLAGLAIAGITGCFAVLAAWYALLVFTFARPSAFPVPKPQRILSLWRAAFPLFVFNALWLVYLTANRWIASILTTPEELGYFSFGANLAFVGLGIISTVAQVYYPKVLARVVQSPSGACSRTIELQSLLITTMLAAVAVIALNSAPDVIALVFPDFHNAAATTVILAISCIPLGLATWLVPICIALSTSPKRDAVRMFLPAFALLLTSMAVGHLIAGTEGLAWGCVVGSIGLMVSILVHLKAIAAIHASTAFRIVGCQVAITATLAMVALASLPHPRGGLAAAAQSTRSAGPPAGWRLAFDEQFDSLRLWDLTRNSGLWEPHYPWGGKTNPSNNELQYYVDPRPGHDPKSLVGFNPFSIDQGALAIRARPLPQEQQVATGLAFASGLLTTVRSFSFTYGYVEMRARVPRGRGLWSAFWLAPVDQSWPPEIDILESLGHDTQSYIMTAHRSFLGFHSQSQFRAQTPDLAENFHTYAVKWTAEEIVWYFDGKQVATMPTPRDSHKPMYMILNLAVGGHWPGSPDASTVFPAALHVDYIRAYLPPEQPR